MTKSRIRRTGSGGAVDRRGGYQARVGNPARDGEAPKSCGRHAGKSDVSGRRWHVFPWEISRSVRNLGLPHRQPGGREREKSAEAIVATLGEGPNLSNARSRGDERGAAPPTTTWGGTAEPEPHRMDSRKRL